MQTRSTEQRRGGAEAERGTAPEPVRKRILIVDDQAEERNIFARYMEFVGGTVLHAENGAEAVRVAREHRPSLILLDLSMPVLDGWGAVRMLKQDARTAHIPVMALTGHRVEWQRLSRAGFCGYLQKPIVPFRVLEQVEQCIGRLAWGDVHPSSPAPGRPLIRTAPAP